MAVRRSDPPATFVITAAHRLLAVIVAILRGTFAAKMHEGGGHRRSSPPPERGSRGGKRGKRHDRTPLVLQRQTCGPRLLSVLGGRRIFAGIAFLRLLGMSMVFFAPVPDVTAAAVS